MYMISFVLKFCIYHRMFLHYTTINTIVNIIDYNFDIGVSIAIYLVILGVALFGILYFYLKEKSDVTTNKKTIIEDRR